MEKAKFLISFLTVPFLFFISGIYLYSYWSSFEIDIFPYLGIQDIIMGFVAPFLKSFALLVLFVAFRTTTKRPGPSITHSVIRNTPFINKNFDAITEWVLFLSRLIVLYSIITLISPGKYENTTYVDYVLPYIGAFSLVIYLGISEIGKEWVPSIILRFIIISFITWLPLGSYFSGKRKASDILENKIYGYTFAKNLKINSKDSTVKFLGKAGNHYIFMSKDNKARYFIKEDEAKNLEIRNVKKKPVWKTLI